MYLYGGIIIIALGAIAFFMTPQKTKKAEVVKTQNPVAEVSTTAQVVAVMDTSDGVITLTLDPKKAPKTVANFVKLAKEGFYDGTKFHRVIPGFMIQGGDPLSKDDSLKARWGTGGPGYSFDDEIGPDNKNDIGTIAMANSGPNTNGSQFFINVADNNFLDTKHTVFGKVTTGMQAVTEIEKTPTEDQNRPIKDVVIKSITIK